MGGRGRVLVDAAFRETGELFVRGFPLVERLLQELCSLAGPIACAHATSVP